jgi:hypothetical protein
MPAAEAAPGLNTDTMGFRENIVGYDNLAPAE